MIGDAVYNGNNWCGLSVFRGCSDERTCIVAVFIFGIPDGPCRRHPARRPGGDTLISQHVEIGGKETREISGRPITLNCCPPWRAKMDTKRATLYIEGNPGKRSGD